MFTLKCQFKLMEELEIFAINCKGSGCEIGDIILVEKEKHIVTEIWRQRKRYFATIKPYVTKKAKTKKT